MYSLLTYHFFFYFVFFLYLTITPTSCESTDKIISIPSQLFLGSYYMFIQYGNHNQLVLLVINTESAYTTQSRSLYTESQSKYLTSTSKNVSFHLFNSNVTLYGDEYKDQCSFGEHYNITLPQFNMLLISELKNFYHQVSNLAFAHKIPNEHHSIVYLLKKEGLITKRTFAIQQTKPESAMLYIGGTPSQVKESYQSYSLLTKVSDIHSTYWTIPISYIFIGEISYIYNNTYMRNYNEAYISSSYNTFVPFIIMDFIIEEVFNEYIDRGDCMLNKYTKEVDCFYNKVNFVNNISFVIGDKALNVDVGKMFQCFNTTKCEFTIKAHSENTIVIGLNIQMLYLVEYDYDQHSVEFSTKDENGIIDVDINILFPFKRIAKWGLILSGVLFGLFIIKALSVSLKKRKIRRFEKFERFVEDFYKKV